MSAAETVSQRRQVVTVPRLARLVAADRYGEDGGTLLEGEE